MDPMPEQLELRLQTTGVEASIREAIRLAIPTAKVAVDPGGAGHYSIEVSANEFVGKNRLACHRMVYAAISHLMNGAQAPVHAVDRLIIRCGDESD